MDKLANALGKTTDEVNDELLKAAYLAAIGQTIVEEEAVKIKTVEEICGKVHNVEKVEKIEVKKQIAPINAMTTFLIKARLPEYKDEIIDGEINVVLSDELENYSK
jgi:hypothetical protein